MQIDLKRELFRQAFYQHYEPLCQYAFTLLKKSHICEDTVQEIFLHIWDKRKDLIGSEDLRYYLYTAVRNNCFTHLEKIKKSNISELTGNEAALESETPLYEKVDESNFISLLKDALQKLPPRCREVFILSRISKLSYQQIAETMGISLKTVENQMGKALRILRAFMKEKLVL